ncbi:helix-turn-helix domain-containing protein [Nocardia gipuzkoensis]|uniref:helix-turn-helix domain-containing protein n=1 Tax=Nocardia gipuzkoensis TaxID=2749991 RepID=UPI001E28EED3|nr:helix-turn-helix domain-containing protein [Nocardia gipuzkoensis]UGT68202.1 helix-turn-helix domain-containing protein [Nocardia gipuzkoensis]
MTPVPKPQRYCARCGGRLNSYNAETLCNPCGSNARDERHRPPGVPPEFWLTDQMRDACATWHIGRVIHAYRTHPFHGRQLPQEVMANWLDLTQAQLSRIEKGPAPEQISKLIRWAEILGIPGELLWFKLPTVEDTTGGVIPARHHDAVALAQWLVTDGTGPAPSGHTDDLHQVSQALEDARRYFDGTVVEFFRHQLARCKADDGSLGPSEALPLTLAVIGAIRRHVRDVQPAVRRKLLALGSDGAEFAGWLYRDLHDPVTATFLYDRAMEWAQAAGSLPMQGYVLLKKSQMAYETRDTGTLMTLAQAANEGPWQLPSQVKAEAMQQEALGMAMLGEPVKAVKQHLDTAEQMLNAAVTANGEEVMSYFNQNTLRLRAAVCYTEAGKPQVAAQLFGQVLSSGSLSRRDTGFFGARQAKALALSGEPDEAARIAVQSVGVARETRSERTMNVVIEVMRSLDTWRHRPMVRQLHDMLLP